MMMFSRYFSCTWILFYPYQGSECYQLRSKDAYCSGLCPVNLLVCCSWFILQVLYHVLGVVPAYQASIGPALNELCLGLQPDEVASVSALFLSSSL